MNNTTGYSLEVRYEIWNDKSGERIEVGPDSDGLDLIEIRYIPSTGTIEQRLFICKEQASLLVEALQKLLTQ